MSPRSPHRSPRLSGWSLARSRVKMSVPLDHSRRQSRRSPPVVGPTAPCPDPPVCPQRVAHTTLTVLSTGGRGLTEISQQTGGAPPRHRLGSGRHAELAIDAFRVSLDGVQGDEQAVTDLLVGEARREVGEHRDLPIAELLGRRLTTLAEAVLA